MRFKMRWRNQAGQTLIDLIVAMALLSLAITSAGALAATAARTGNEAGRRTQATALAAGELEALRNLRDTASKSEADWPLITDPSQCSYLYMQRSGNVWQRRPLDGSGSYQAYTTEEYVDFERQIKICPMSEYNLASRNLSSSVSVNVNNVEVNVRWREGSSEVRQVTLTTILGNWKQ